MTTRLKQIYQKLIERNPALKKRLGEQKALELWANTFSPQITRNTEPYRVKNGVLWVRVSSSAWAQELSLLKKELLEKLNQALGQERIKDVRFQVQGRACRSEAKAGRSEDA